MNEILAEQVNRAEHFDSRSFFMTVIRMVLRLAAAEICTTVLVFFLKISLLKVLFYAYAIAEVLFFLRQILASDRYVLMPDRLLMERRMGDMVMFSLALPVDRIAAVREYAAGEKLSVSYAHVSEFRRQANVPFRVRIARGVAVISSRLAVLCAGTAVQNPCGLVLAYYEGIKVKACTFEPDAGMLRALEDVLGDRMGTDDRLARPHLRTFMARIQARAFPALYPHVEPLVTPEDEEWARAYVEQRKREKELKRKKTEKGASSAQQQRTKQQKKQKRKKGHSRPKDTGKGKSRSGGEHPEQNERAVRSMEIPDHPVFNEADALPEKEKDVRKRRSRTQVEDEHAGEDSFF